MAALSTPYTPPATTPYTVLSSRSLRKYVMSKLMQQTDKARPCHIPRIPAKLHRSATPMPSSQNRVRVRRAGILERGQVRIIPSRKATPPSLYYWHRPLTGSRLRVALHRGELRLVDTVSCSFFSDLNSLRSPGWPLGCNDAVLSRREDRTRRVAEPTGPIEPKA